MLERLKDFINPDINPDLSQASDYQKSHLPTLWLLGKTGAGKSTLIQSLTGATSIDIGNGFEPCTSSSDIYNFPSEQPLMSFLDTKGLSEADYDPSEDIEACQNKGHAVIVVAKAEESEQSDVVSALEKIRKRKLIKNILIVHTAVIDLDDKQRENSIAHNQLQFEKAWGSELPAVAVDFEHPDDEAFPLVHLIDKISELLPAVGITLQNKEHSATEEGNFQTLKNEVLWYAGSASASDLIPAVGLVSVPAIQAKMLHSLAQQYGVEWNKATFSKLIATLGAGFGVQYGLSLGVRQLVKFIPVYGQTVGIATAAAMSFATTYGLGRAACYYFYCESRNEEVDHSEMQRIYKESFSSMKKARDNE